MKSKQWKSAGLICLVFIGGLSSCTNGGQGSKGDALDAQPIVGSVEILNGDSVWVCNQSALKDTLVLPLSYFADELQIVKLDNRDEALVPVRNAFWSFVRYSLPGMTVTVTFTPGTRLLNSST